MFGMNGKKVKTAWMEALKRIRAPFIALVFAVPLVRIMMQSGTNPNGYSSMPIAMAQYMADVFKGAWPLIDPFIGALGSFMAGSNTVSNMLFAVFQYSIADNTGLSHIIIVGLQNVGGALGNMICVHNVIAACNFGLIGVEGLIIRRNLIPCLCSPYFRDHRPGTYAIHGKRVSFKQKTNITAHDKLIATGNGNYMINSGE